MRSPGIGVSLLNSSQAPSKVEAEPGLVHNQLPKLRDVHGGHKHLPAGKNHHVKVGAGGGQSAAGLEIDERVEVHPSKGNRAAGIAASHSLRISEGPRVMSPAAFKESVKLGMSPEDMVDAFAQVSIC